MSFFFGTDEETGIPSGPLMALKAIASIMGIDGSVMNQTMLDMDAMMNQFRASMIEMDQRMRRIEEKLDEVLNERHSADGYGEHRGLYLSYEKGTPGPCHMDTDGNRSLGDDRGRGENSIPREPG